MLSFDSLDVDNDRIPDEDYKPGKRFVSTNTIITAVGLVVVLAIVVGLLCGLLGAKNKRDCQATDMPPTGMPSTCSEDSSTSSTTTPSVSRRPATSGTTLSPSTPWYNPRLPETLKPSHYDLELAIDLDGDTRFNGTITVTMICREATDVIVMHAKELDLASGTARLERLNADGDHEGNVPGFLKEPWTYEENQYLVAELDGELQAGVEYRFTIDFSAPLIDGGLFGLYKSSYKTATGETRYLAATFFAPTNARKAFPCFDEPAMKATFNITVIHQSGFTALSNMPLISNDTIDNPHGQAGEPWVRSVFERTLPMSTYIVCYVVCDFEFEERTTAGNVTFRVWARREALSSVVFALEDGVAMLDYYDYYYGTKFPLPKMDMIAIPDSSVGAMENWGLVTYREANLLYTPGETSASSQQLISVIIAHELAHQWFGNLVSFVWWNDLWLKEGFASYTEFIGTDVRHPDWDMTDQFVARRFYESLEADAMTTSRPLIVDVDTADDINQQYDSIAYDKGSSIIRMIQNFLGESAFRRGLQIYLDRFKYANAINTDLWNCFTEEHNITDIDVKLVMDTWTLQMGYPTVSVSRDYGVQTQTFLANQSRFLINPEANTTNQYDDLGYVWHVPLRFTTEGQAEFADAPLKWLPPDTTLSTTLPDSTGDGDWLLLNVNAYGHYRVNYDAHNWDLLITQLNTNHEAIPVSNRAGMITDAFSLAQAGDLSYTTAFNLSQYLDQERHYVAWRTGERTFEYIDLMLSRTSTYGPFQAYMLSIVEPFYQDVGWDDSRSSHLEQLGRVVAIKQACRYGNQDCVTRATSLFKNWMKNPSNNTVPPNQKYNVYCTAIGEGGQEEWYFAFNQYESTIIASERAILLQALACSRKPWILSQYLEMTLDRIKSQDAANVVTYVASNTIGYDLAWKFFQANWAFFRETYGNNLFQFAVLIEGVTAYFNTELLLSELLDFIAEHPDQGTGRRALSSAVEQTRANVRWMEDFRPDVDAWLQQRTQSRA
ncbi:aminopeptidase Ey-like [Diadema antillarum]|uniref:aminopeptidase Ey-like n=1 Tax=Diadema antillarum TaxID=105358 RepID=UPI003A899778